ncbi:MAG: hypothetical protein ACYC3I_17660 [Gemmataceae bacterium]
MKSTQWTAVLVLILMVGGITFVTVYLGGGKLDVTDSPPEVPATLTFPIKNYPRDGEKNLTTEVRQTGHFDFWFYNESEKDLAVGLTDKGCTCSEVELTVAPTAWLPRIFELVVAKQALQLPPHGWDNLTSLAVALQREQQSADWPLNGAATMTFDKENSITVPAHALGRVRLSWRQEGTRQLQAFAELWIGQRGGSVSARLDANVRISEALEVRRDVMLPSFNVRQLEMGEVEPAWIVCWSVTRRSFPLQVAPDNPRIKPESDAVEVGDPIPLTEADIRQLESDQVNSLLTILSGYKIPVRLKARAKDGTPIDWGSFRRYIRLSSTAEGIEPVVVQVFGEVVGDVVVTGGKTGAMIDLGPFPQKRGTKGDISLHTDEKHLDLEVDTKRLPAYLRVRLSEPKDSGGHRSWLLHVEVPPNAARGEFPNADNPTYRDSAIYVKTKGKQPRCIRVPVIGTANIS